MNHFHFAAMSGLDENVLQNCFYFSSLFVRESHNEWVSSSAPRTVLTGLVSLITQVAAIA